MADKTYSIQIKAIDMFSKTISGIGKVANDFTSKIKEAKAKSEKAFEFASNTKVAADGLAKIRDNSIGLFTNVIKEGSEFEESMSKVAAISRTSKTSTEFKQMEEAARRMGATTSFSAKEASDAMVFMAMAGLTVEKGLIPATEASLSLAKAAGVDLPRSADVVSDVMSQFTKTMLRDGVDPMNQASRVADVMAMTMTSTNTSLETLYESFKYVGPVADKLGISIEETSAAIGLLGNVGIKGSSAGTAVAGAMARLASPTSQATAVLNKFGVKVKDQQGNMRGFTDIIGDLSEQTKNLGSADKMAVIVSIFGKEASRMAGMSELLSLGKKPIQDLTDKIDNATDASTNMANVMGDNVIGKMKELESMQSEFKLTVWDLFAKALKELIPVFTSVFTALSNFVKENPNIAKGIVYLIIAIGAISTVLISLIAIIGWVASMYGTWILVSKVVGFIISKMLVGAITSLLPILWSVIGAVWSFTAALLANPITWIVIGIIALIAGLVWLYDNVEWVRQKFDSFFSLISDWWNNLSGFGKVIVSIFAPFIALPAVIIAEWENIVEFFDNIMPDWIKDLLGRGDVAVNVNETTQNTPLVTKQAAGLNTQNQFTLPTIPTIGEQVKTQNNNSNVMIDFKNLPAGVSVSKDGKSVTQPGNTGFSFGG